MILNSIIFNNDTIPVIAYRRFKTHRMICFMHLTKQNNNQKVFIANATTLFQVKQMKADWSKLFLIYAEVEINILKLCYMVDHETKFCPLQLSEKKCFFHTSNDKMVIIAIFVIGSVFSTAGNNFAILHFISLTG